MKKATTAVSECTHVRKFTCSHCTARGRDEMAQQSGKHRSQQFSIIIGVERGGGRDQEETERFVREGGRPTLFTQYVGPRPGRRACFYPRGSRSIFNITPSFQACETKGSARTNGSSRAVCLPSSSSSSSSSPLRRSKG